MEALALGLPVVATDVGGIPEAVTAGVDGLLVPPRSPELLAGAIRCLVEDEPLRRRMGAAASELSSAFDINRAVGRIEALYQEVLAR
jgi:glycosyltransferase involved in cell wall biosynthesis